MNQGRIWCVVHPTVGLPLFLGSVALTSLAVHTAVMTHTTWMSSYWAGSTRTKVSMETTQPSVNPGSSPAAFSFKVTPVPATDATSPASFVITVTPGAATTNAANDTATHAVTPVAVQTAKAD
jgi:light-harvesting protein B-800-850 alpha chain